MVKKSFDIYNFILSNKIIFFILLIIILLTIIYYNNSTYESFHINHLKYFRCDTKKLGFITNEVFNEYGITKDNTNWNIYVPCGYNYVEKELLTIQVSNNSNSNKKFIFGINGCDLIVSKNKIWETLVSCYGRNEASKYMPESYVLHDKNEMKLFKQNFKPKTIYILKKNVQRKEGLKLTSDLNIILSSLMENYRVVQSYLTDLYLINRRKVNLRIYLLVVIKNGYKSFYISDIGKCIYTKKEYNHNNLDFESNITSYNLDMTVYEKNPRHFDELYKYIDMNSNHNGHDNGNILKNNIALLMNKICICLSKSIYQSSNLKNTICFQLFGADVIFNNQLHPYLLEFNKGPDMIPRDEIDKKMKTTVQEDMFRIVGILPPKIDDKNIFYETYKTKL
jgi:hypothetical protein